MSDERTSQDAGSKAPSMSSQKGQSDTNTVSSESTIPVAVEPARQMQTYSSRRSTSAFCGPTSPEYSLNAAQRRMQCDKTSGPGSGSAISPSVDENQSDDGDDHPYSPGTEYVLPFHQAPRHILQPCLLQFRKFLPKAEAIRVLLLYHSMMGELHPICNIELMVKQTEACYARPVIELGTAVGDGLPITENDLLIINLALTIALCTETGVLPDTGRSIYDSCRDLINTKLASLTTDIKHVHVVFLVALRHFFMGRIRLAWRTCGQAGRMAMELGLHSREMSQQCLENDEQRAAVVELSCSLVVLDRQLSASAGLPHTFQNADFDLAVGASVNTPYLRHMMEFTLMSHKFNEPISRVATGGCYMDDDSFEVTNFLVEQWRKRATENWDFTRLSDWETQPSKIPPAWVVILYLRANAVRSILLRPFFLSDPANPASKRQVKSALDIISDSINVLSVLDKTSNIYRIQHPSLQHILAGTCALLFLVLSYTAQNHAAPGLDLPSEFFSTVNRNFWTALDLSRSYNEASLTSRKLYRRLNAIKDTLLRAGYLSPDYDPNQITQLIPDPQQSDMLIGSHMRMMSDQGLSSRELLPRSNHNSEIVPVNEMTIFPGTTNTMLGPNPFLFDFNMNLEYFDWLDYEWPSDDVAHSLSGTGFGSL
ncbi:uncharacterized protein A1O9_01547 [Exophiala aquamarina CBS 119918]|uniref:Xylanolytic transcriptional activator regulatory domain-containing protein n=1 Tax=Exophiala aquamarina CBS 119918 TaxID=1182545 RepID=A0A072PTX3_9EURO|nr:uncharacterized protein A1O9_01547 [Exophiala aquamarina CBS 119918]KEF63569.1 hypothetical protein A1O9_01547 [Exophiala aquamarina CBS 119918]